MAKPSRTWGVRQTAFWVVASPENRAFHSHAVRGCTPRAFATAYGLHPSADEQQRLTSLNNTLLGRRRANRILDGGSLRRRQRDRFPARPPAVKAATTE